MVSNFDSLPFEIQTLVYLHLENKVPTIKNCMLVCQNWRQTYQQLFYSSVTLYRYKNVKAFLNSLRKNRSLGIIVKKLTFCFEDAVKDPDGSLDIAEIFTHLPNLEYFDDIDRLFYELLSDALAFNRLPNLNQIALPAMLDEVHDYIACAILMRDRLKSLFISESYEKYEGRRAVRKMDSVRFYRLFNVLNEFKNLTELVLQKKSENIIQFIDKAVLNCPTLRKLTLFNKENDSKIESIGVTISSYTPVYHVKHLEVYASVADNTHLLLYIMHKFPQLEELILHEFPLLAKLEIVDRTF